MQRTITIRLLALLLTFSLVSEITVYLNYGDLITIEMDADGEEEESKEDKLNERELNEPIPNKAVITSKEMDFTCFDSNWNSPVLDSVNQPPEFV